MHTTLRNIPNYSGRFSHFYRPRRPLGWVEVQLYSFQDLGTPDGGGGQPHAPTASTTGKDLVPIVQEAAWTPGPVWTGVKSRPDRDSIPDRPARSQSLYRLSYPAHHNYSETGKNSHCTIASLCSWFPCVYKQMLRWFPRFEVATTCFSCSPPDLNLLVTNFIFCIHVK